VKASPIALLQRRRAAVWRTTAPNVDEGAAVEISASAARVYQALSAHGASFFEELAEASGLLNTQLEAALAELVAKGLANSDSFKGLRALLVPEDKKRRYRGINPFGIEDAGRWSLLAPSSAESELAIEHIAGVLLRRYGVVFRALLGRESAAPPWQDLLKVYRKLEARGELRGGRFVAGHYGEQFAQPEALEGLRAIRKQPDPEEICAVSAADPLNLVGIITPGPKLPALPGNRVLYKAGVPLAVWAGKEMRWLATPNDVDEWAIKTSLIRRSPPPQLKAYL
jgi:ATP-dependent Lhr-like helicase